MVRTRDILNDDQFDGGNRRYHKDTNGVGDLEQPKKQGNFIGYFIDEDDGRKFVQFVREICGKYSLIFKFASDRITVAAVIESPGSLEFEVYDAIILPAVCDSHRGGEKTVYMEKRWVKALYNTIKRAEEVIQPAPLGIGYSKYVLLFMVFLLDPDEDSDEIKVISEVKIPTAEIGGVDFNVLLT